MIEKLYTPESIDPNSFFLNDIFVFGSNLLGIHGLGAAKLALIFFGAKWGKGKGLSGQSYAFPTVKRPGRKFRLSNELLNKEMIDFLKCVRENKDKRFFLTKIGCGLAGIPVNEMKEIFQANYSKENYENLIYPIEFEKE